MNGPREFRAHVNWLRKRFGRKNGVVPACHLDWVGKAPWTDKRGGTKRRLIRAWRGAIAGAPLVEVRGRRDPV